MTEFSFSEKELKRNTDILEGTFSKFGLEVVNVGIQYADMLGGKGIKFFCEIISNSNLPYDEWLNIKINVYDATGELISMGEHGFNTSDFTGYDTLSVAVFHETIHYDAAKARIYLTR